MAVGQENDAMVFEVCCSCDVYGYINNFADIFLQIVLYLGILS
jgi:hypothetical protein